MTRIVSIKFRNAGKHYDFLARDLQLKSADQVVVETDRGRALGIVVSAPVEKDESQLPKGMKGVLRLASDEDRALAATNASREESALRFCRQRVQERGLEMKLVKAEYLFDGSKIIFYFTADGRIDFRELVKDLAHYFHTRIEMRQIGVRDEAKLIGGLGICGRELCCCSYMSEFAPVSVKMAKEQQLALNPNKISGQCGRLLCCLGYEYETYSALRKGMPKNGARLTIDNHSVQVVDVNVLGQKLQLRIDDGRVLKLSREEFAELQKPNATLPESDAPRSRRNDSQSAESKPPRKDKSARETTEKRSEDDPTRNRNRRRRKPSGGQRSEGKPASAAAKPEQKTDKPATASQPPTNGEAPTAAKKRRRRRGRRKPKTENKES